MDYNTARKAMVDCQVRPNDVTDHRLLAALETVPKEQFLPSEQRSQAYIEKEIAYAPGRILPTARDFAKLLEVLDIKQNDLVLDVACGTGYSTAILARLSEMVVAVESDEELVAKAEEILAGIDIGNAAVISGDVVKGAAKQGPFNVIFIGGVIEEAPAGLFDQLAENGRVGAFLSENGVTSGVVFIKSASGVSKTKRFTASGKSVLPGFEKAKEFIF